MHKKFIWSSFVLATLLIMMAPTFGVQRLVIDTDELNSTHKSVSHINWKLAKPIPVTTHPSTLEWNGMRIQPVRSYQHDNEVEYILANNNETGFTVVRGQTMQLNMVLKYRANAYDLDTKADRCFTNCCTVICCPLVLPCRIGECGMFCGQSWKKTENQTEVVGVGQILFQTDSQPKTIRIKVSGNDWNSLLLIPEDY